MSTREITTGNALGLSYRIFARSGTVTASETRSKTEVSGSVSGGGGYSNNGTGYTAPVSGSISSETTDYQDIFLTDDNGVEHLIQTENFLVPCREGQRATFFFIKSGRSQSGPYFQAYNHNSRQMYDHGKSLRSDLFPWLTTLIVLAVTGVPMFFSLLFDSEGGLGPAIFGLVIVAVVVGICMWIVGSIVAAIRATRVKADSRFRQFKAQLENEPAPSAQADTSPTAV